MTEYAASPSCVKLRMQVSCVKERCHLPQNSHLWTVKRRSSNESFNVFRRLTMRRSNTVLSVSNLKVSPFLRESSSRSRCLGPLADIDGMTASDWIPITDQVLLMASMFLTYIAGVVPAQNSGFSSRKKIYAESIVHESPTFSGSAPESNTKNNLSYAWDLVKGKLLDGLETIEQESSLSSRVLESEGQKRKLPLSLYAISEIPKLRLLLACFQQLEDEVNTVIISDSANFDQWMDTFSDIIRESCRPACSGWLEKEFLQSNSLPNKALISLMVSKLKGDDSVLESIRKSGKEDLYAELLYFHKFGSHRVKSCYDHGLFLLHGVSILEDLVITLADGIASSFLELISVDGYLSYEMNSASLDLCNFSTRALQKLRNEVALNQWLHQNAGAVVSMYEDCFDLHTLQIRTIEKPNKDGSERCSLWKKLTQAKSEDVSSPLRYIVVDHFSMPVKRTKELRALTGWRYYYSLFLELSDISMPLIRAVVDKISSAISFFLVTLIGRSLGLIYTGIRQSLRWK